MAYRTRELDFDRHLEGMVRVGRITKVKTQTNVMATVTYPDRSFQSQYLIVLQRNTIGMQDYYVPVEGETVWVLMQGRSLTRGIILGSAYTDTNPPPWNTATIRGMMFADGTYIIYDTANGGNYQINTPGQANIFVKGNVNLTTQGNLVATVSGTATLKAPTIDLQGNVNITGNLDVSGSITGASENIAGNTFSGSRTGGPI